MAERLKVHRPLPASAFSVLRKQYQGGAMVVVYSKLPASRPQGSSLLPLVALSWQSFTRKETSDNKKRREEKKCFSCVYIRGNLCRGMRSSKGDWNEREPTLKEARSLANGLFQVDTGASCYLRHRISWRYWGSSWHGVTS